MDRAAPRQRSDRAAPAPAAPPAPDADDDLFAIVGRLYVENVLLRRITGQQRARLAQLEAAADA